MLFTVWTVVFIFRFNKSALESDYVVPVCKLLAVFESYHISREFRVICLREICICAITRMLIRILFLFQVSDKFIPTIGPSFEIRSWSRYSFMRDLWTHMHRSCCLNHAVILCSASVSMFCLFRLALFEEYKKIEKMFQTKIARRQFFQHRFFLLRIKSIM